MQGKQQWGFCVLSVVFMLLFAGCEQVAPLIPDVELPQLFSTATPLPPPTPVGDTLTYEVAQQRYGETVTPGNFIPGTQLRFLGKDEERFLMQIDGLDSVKQAGDTLFWRGMMAPGVLGQYDLILSPTYSRDVLLANGQVSLTIFDPQPAEAALPLSDAEPFRFNNINLYYIVPQGREVPGTSLIYRGFNGTEVEFSGLSSFPRFRVGDSLRWTGLLRQNVYITNDMRIERVTEQGVIVRGSAELRVYPAFP